MNDILKRYVKETGRMPLKLYMRSRLQISNVRLIASNCVGGVLLHDLGLQFQTPTINMTVSPFGRFCSNLDYYIHYPIENWIMSQYRGGIRLHK